MTTRAANASPQMSGNSEKRNDHDKTTSAPQRGDRATATHPRSRRSELSHHVFLSRCRLGLASCAVLRHRMLVVHGERLDDGAAHDRRIGRHESLV